MDKFFLSRLSFSVKARYVVSVGWASLSAKSAVQNVGVALNYCFACMHETQVSKNLNFEVSFLSLVLSPLRSFL